MALMKAKTIYGTVTGVPGNEPQTTVFKGVPFAKPPVGPLRFHEPVEPDPWDGELVCDKWPNAPVMEPNPHYQGLPESEDCLYMNIFTPAESPNAKLPVMFWIYGGGFNYGCIYTDVSESLHKGESARYRGEALNKRGVILVTINYRVSVMGFMSHPKLIERDGHAGNYGLLDLVAGLNWVHDNIAAFGGDPDNVTIFGQSAGAVSCRMLMTSPLTKGKGLFRRAIIQSGCSLNEPEPYRTSDWIGEWAEKTLDSLGLSYEDLLTKDACELARTMPLRSYQLFTGMENPKFPKKPAMFTPCLDNYSLTAVPGVSLYCGEYDQDIDIICGTVADDILQPVKHCFEPIRDNAAVMRTVAYSPSVVMGRRQIETERKPIYAYFFERNIAGIDSFSGKSGPYHGSEIAYEFGTLELMEHDFTEYDYQLSEAIMDYWTNFAKNGNPNGGMLPKWTPFTAESPCNMNFRDDGFQMRNLIDSPKAERIIRVMQSCPGCIEALPDYI